MASYVNGAQKWHASFKSENAQLMLEVANAVNRAGREFTVVHDAQRSATWFETWKAKCMEAHGVIVCFTDAYRANFTDALKMEAGVILSLYKARKIKLFILDPSDNTNAANIRMNILDSAPGMGDIDAWPSLVYPPFTRVYLKRTT